MEHSTRLGLQDSTPPTPTAAQRASLGARGIRVGSTATADQCRRLIERLERLEGRWADEDRSELAMIQRAAALGSDIGGLLSLHSKSYTDNECHVNGWRCQWEFFCDEASEQLRLVITLRHPDTGEVTFRRMFRESALLDLSLNPGVERRKFGMLCGAMVFVRLQATDPITAPRVRAPRRPAA